jgi:hypothetical protein
MAPTPWACHIFRVPVFVISTAIAFRHFVKICEVTPN